MVEQRLGLCGFIRNARWIHFVLSRDVRGCDKRHTSARHITQDNDEWKLSKAFEIARVVLPLFFCTVKNPPAVLLFLTASHSLKCISRSCPIYYYFMKSLNLLHQQVVKNSLSVHSILMFYAPAVPGLSIRVAGNRSVFLFVS